MSGFSCVSVSQQGGAAHKTMLRRHPPFVIGGYLAFLQSGTAL